MVKNRSVSNLFMMLTGVSLIGFTVFLLRLADFGTDPFTTLNLGISSFLSLPYGSFQLGLNALLLIIVGLLARNYIGLGTIANMTLVGYLSDFFLFIFLHLYDGPIPFSFRVFLLAAAMIMMSLGVAMYMVTSMGVSPYDALSSIIEGKTNGKIPFQTARIVLDSLAVIIGFSFGATVGVGTILTALFMGPFIQFFKKKLERLLSQRQEVLAE